MFHGTSFVRVAIAWIVLAAVVPTHPLRAQELDLRAERATSDNYGRTPDTVIPYRRFHEPYVRFFQTVPTFREFQPTAHTAKLPGTVRIGVLAPTGSAPDADLGREMIDGITLAMELANADGGYQGIPFDMVLRADAALWGSTANAMVAFKSEDHVVGVIGSIDGANTHVALRVALKIQLPLVNTATTDPTLTETAVPWMVRCMADDRQQGYALAHHIFNTCGINKVATLRVNDRYGRMGIAEFRDAARRLGHPLRMELRWERGDRDFGKQLDRMIRTGVEAVVLWGNATDTAAITREMRRRNLPQRMFGCDRMVSERFLKEAGDAAEGVVAVATFNPAEPNPRYTEFSAAFRERFHRDPGTFAAHAYDGANVLIESIRKGGLSCICIRDALYAHRHYEGVTGRIEFDTTLNDIGPVYIATVTGGRYAYEQAEFVKTARAVPRTIPYRTLSDSLPDDRVARIAETSRQRDAFRIGCFLPLDPPGRSVVRGLKMALAEGADSRSGAPPIKLIVRDSRGAWGGNADALTSLIVEENVLALVGSTERRGTHLMETLAAKLHVPLITLCADDPTIYAIPLPWVFSVAPAGEYLDEGFVRRSAARFGREAIHEAAMGYDAGQLLIRAIRGGYTTRAAVQRALVAADCNGCASGSFRFDAFGRRVGPIDSAPIATLGKSGSVIGIPRGDGGGKGRP